MPEKMVVQSVQMGVSGGSTGLWEWMISLVCELLK